MVSVNVVYAANDNYASLAGVSMISLLENNKNIETINFHILADNISADNKERLEQIVIKYDQSIQIIDTMDVLQGFGEKGVTGYDNALDMGLTAYARLAIADLLPDIDRVLYLDCDTIVLDDLKELVEIDLEGRPVAMAYDCLQNRYKKYINLDLNDAYYNSGVMLIDINKWREQRCKERIFEHVTQVRSSYPLVDQDLINVVLGKNVCVLGAKYNYLSQYFLYNYEAYEKVYELRQPYFYSKEQFSEKNQAVVVHFCGQTFARPWFSNSEHPLKDKYLEYYAMSPWEVKDWGEWEWKLPYKVQLILWKYAPHTVSVYMGKLMQRVFIWMNYKV